MCISDSTYNILRTPNITVSLSHITCHRLPMFSHSYLVCTPTDFWRSPRSDQAANAIRLPNSTFPASRRCIANRNARAGGKAFACRSCVNHGQCGTTEFFCRFSAERCSADDDLLDVTISHNASPYGPRLLGYPRGKKKTGSKNKKKTDDASLQTC
jgi:hypothetical protein